MLNQGSGHGRSSWDTLTTAKAHLTSVVPPSWITTGLSLQLTVLKIDLKKDLQLTLMSLLVSILCIPSHNWCSHVNNFVWYA